ncbi:MFS transporter [Blastococcus sp. VKM Ac-2987]|uniref:MFS transporter n=1 Tax=Blastococcus sp. VKM Ac-2987 TaxID=3004141 RepID=UPI0022AB9C8B|nr:MFS transporter [Blastococcus sp. VKM Ac-2987]MCZ2861151.1 MFS transporter [Blastococcus sp. VKM Ac-2987]
MADPPPDAAPRATKRATLQAVAVSVLGVLPAFLVGALAVQIRADLDVGLGLFGFAAATLFAVSGLCARPAGRLVQRLGSARGTALAACLAIASLTAVALAQSPVWLMLALAVGGLGNAVAQPSANLGISELVTERRLGLAFGMKQAAIPAATLLGGLAVPGIALVFGWRWAAVAGVALAVSILVWSLVGGRDARGHPPADRTPAGTDKGLPRGGLLVLTLGGFLGSSAATSTGVFLVDSAVAAGTSPAAAGLLFAACSVLGLVNRIGFGWLADRHPDRSRYLFIANLLASGAVGYALLATGRTVPFLIGSAMAYGLGWAWTGLFHFAVIRDNRAAAASVTGFVQTGLSLGAASGPLFFGVVAQTFSYTAAWSVAAALSLLAALTIRLARRMVRRSRGLPVAELHLRRHREGAHAQAPT